MLALSQIGYAQLRLVFPDLPETPLIVRAFDHAGAHMPDYLFNHVLRSWITATRLAAMHAIADDAEVLAVSTILHDIGHTPLGDGSDQDARRTGPGSGLTSRHGSGY